MANVKTRDIAEETHRLARILQLESDIKFADALGLKELADNWRRELAAIGQCRRDK